MQSRDRSWLRSFLSLDARANDGSAVPLRDVERQEDTVLRALSLLDTQPGVVLADEVGMGKTFEALGIVAAWTDKRQDSRTLILTPGPDLNRKWDKELRAFGDENAWMYKGFRGRFASAWHLAELVEKLRSTSVVVAPMTIFAGSRSDATRAYLLTAWAESAGLSSLQITTLFKHYREGRLEKRRYREERFLDAFAWSEVEPALTEALREHQRQPYNLGHIFEEGGYAAFDHKHSVDRLLGDLRVRLLRALVPAIDLLVVDEAHKLKNEQSVRTSSLRTMFEKRFDKALFLTATPFQLSTDELRNVFKLFALAQSAPATMEQSANTLLEAIQSYQKSYDDLDRTWSMLDAVAARQFEDFFDAHPTLDATPDDPSIAAVVSHAHKLLRAKTTVIEPGLRAWMIRSLREDKRVYRSSRARRLRPEGGEGVPFLLYERFIAEMFRSHARTHKAAVQINMVSSFAAARDGALLSEETRATLPPSVEPYRTLLQRIVSGTVSRNGHPKVRHVVQDALDAALRGEKTLIFCTRVATLRELKNEIEARWDQHALALWRKAYPGIELSEIYDQHSEDEDERRLVGRHARLRNRFQNSRDPLYLALRERYIETVLRATQFANDQQHTVLARANEALGHARLSESHAERFQWSVAKRCVEHATALLLREQRRPEDIDASAEALEQLCDPRYIQLGFDLEKDDLESSSDGDHAAQWRIGSEHLKAILRPAHLWQTLTAQFIGLPAALRVRTVERFAGYLVSRYVPFLAESLGLAKEQGVDVDSLDSLSLLEWIDAHWRSDAGRRWIELIKSFLAYAIGLDEQRRRDVLDDVVKAGAIVRHTVDGESRELLREAFNTPLYPMILVANEVMQEGLDLHHHCRRVIHHDLPWNPAQLEQRVGRVDRLGSLVQRLRDKDPSKQLEIELPLVRNTIDERLERTVRLRERWLEFLLGAAPKIEEYGLADQPSLPLPQRFAEALKIELGPRQP